MSYSDTFGLRTATVTMNDIANAIDGRASSGENSDITTLTNATINKSGVLAVKSSNSYIVFENNNTATGQLVFSAKEFRPNSNGDTILGSESFKWHVVSSNHFLNYNGNCIVGAQTSGHDLRFRTSGGDRLLVAHDGLVFRPFSHLEMNLGSSSNNFNQFFSKHFSATDGAIWSERIYTLTTSSASNVHIASNHALRRSTSSRKYKINIKSLEDFEFIYNLRPVSFNDKADFTPHIGLIAEEVAEIESRLVTKNEKGEPEAVEYAHLVSPIIKAVQDLNNRLKQLEEKVK